MRYAFGKELAVVAPVHDFQNLIAAALEGNMEMGCEMAAMFYELNHIVRQQVRFARRDAVAHLARNHVERSKQVDKCLTSSAPEIADIDARQHDLFRPLIDCLLRHLHRALDTAAAALTSRHGDGAVCAVIVAAVLHFEETAGAVVTRIVGMKSEPFFGESSVGLRQVRNGYLAWVRSIVSQGFYCCHNARYEVLVVGSYYIIHTRYRCHFFWTELRITTRYNQRCIRIFAMQTANSLTPFLISDIRY